MSDDLTIPLTPDGTFAVTFSAPAPAPATIRDQVQTLLARAGATLERPCTFWLRRDRAGLADLFVRWDQRHLRVELRAGDRIPGAYTFDAELWPVTYTASHLVRDLPVYVHGAGDVTDWLQTILTLFHDARVDVQVPLTGNHADPTV